MTKDFLIKKKLPDAPGVYFFMGARKEILYIGKATSLRTRVRSYFSDDIREKRSELISRMVADAKAVDYTITDSVLEALILEANLIRTHKPRYNSQTKDDKSFNHLVITAEEYPRVLVVRGKDLSTRFRSEEIQHVFGPFPNGSLFREALKIVRRLFKFYDIDTPIENVRSKLGRGMIDFNRQIGLYPGQGEKESYKRTIRHLVLFFQGKKKVLMREITRDMMRAATAERFEEAGALKRRLFALKHIEDVTLLRDDVRTYRDDRRARIEAYDVAHMAGRDMVGVMTVVEGGERMSSEYRTFTINSVSSANDPAALSEVLERRLDHSEWPLPQLMVVDGNSVQKRAAEKVLERVGVVIPVLAVVKDEFHRPKRIIGPEKLIALYSRDIVLANGEAHRFSLSFHRKKRRSRLFKE
jgi:excinuclease ABC subunit C